MIRDAFEGFQRDLFLYLLVIDKSGKCALIGVK